MRAFIGSNIFIYAAQSHPSFGKKCKQIIEDIEKEKMHEAGIPVFSTPEKAVTALYALVRYNELQSKNA